MTTAACRASPWSLIAALDADGRAEGSLYVDDGVSVDPTESLLVDFTAAEGALYASARGEYVDANPLANVTVLGLGSAPANVSFNGVGVPFVFDETCGVLRVRGLQNVTADGAWGQGWVVRW